MMLRVVILTLAVMAVAAPAMADCRADIATLQARIDAMSRKSPNLGPAKKELAKAVDQQQDEVACDNQVARAWRALRKPVPVANDSEARD